MTFRIFDEIGGINSVQKSKTILDENVFANNGDNVGIERKDQFNSISLAETDEEENGSPHWGNFRTKKVIWPKIWGT